MFVRSIIHSFIYLFSHLLRFIPYRVAAPCSCLQDSDLLLKIAEEVNETLKNKVSSHSSPIPTNTPP